MKNSKLKILAIGDTANLMRDLRLCQQNMIIDIMKFREEVDVLITEKDTVVVENDNIFKPIRYILSNRNKYDIFIVLGWGAARTAYLSGLNYIIYFVGDDLRKAPFREKSEFGDFTNNKIHNLLEQRFYKNVMLKAVGCVAVSQELFNLLKKYRSDAFRIDNVPIDKTFNSLAESVNMPKAKFTFFSPARISYDKGFDILWNAIKQCKSDFEVFQVEWFDSELEGKKNEIMRSAPENVKFIPLIKRADMPRYYAYCDGVMNNMKMGFVEGITREASICRKPVLNYINSELKSLIDGKEVIPPFLPKSTQISEISKTIDMIVNDRIFRESLVKDQYEFIKKLTDPSSAINQWETFIQNLLKQKQNKIKKSLVIIVIRIIFFLLIKGTKRIKF